MAIAEKKNIGFGFPSAAGGVGTLHQVAVWKTEQAQGAGGRFLFNKGDAAAKDSARAVAQFREARRSLMNAGEVKQREGWRVEFNLPGHQPMTGNSYLLCAMLADHLSRSRPDLWRTDQKQLAIVATGIPDGTGHFGFREGRNVTEVEAKLRAILDMGQKQFGDHAERLFLMPRQQLTETETRLLEDLRAGGWQVHLLDSVEEALALSALSPSSESEPKKEGMASGKRWFPPPWPVIGTGAAIGAVLLAFGLSTPERDAPPVDVASSPPLPPVVENLAYSGTLTIDVDYRSQGETFTAPVGKSFFPDDLVTLVLHNEGATPAVAVIADDRAVLAAVALPAHGKDSASFPVSDLVGSGDKALILAADCSDQGCASARQALLADLGQTTKDRQPVGRFKVTANTGEPLQSWLVFNMSRPAKAEN